MTRVAARLGRKSALRPTRGSSGSRDPAVSPRAEAVRIFGLAADGVCPAIRVTTNAVRSYRTFSPLLEERQNAERRMLNERSQSSLLVHSAFCNLNSAFPHSGLFSVALSVGSHRLDVIKHRALGSSDFPHPRLTMQPKARSSPLPRQTHCSRLQIKARAGLTGRTAGGYARLFQSPWRNARKNRPVDLPERKRARPNPSPWFR
jgi:hypothetical protein